MHIIILLSLFAVLSLFGQQDEKVKVLEYPLDSVQELKLINVEAEIVEHMGKTGIKISKQKNYENGETLVVLPDISFQNGTIELEISGEPAPDAAPQMRGFVGIAFRVDPTDYSRYECFYLRPTNARANNQLQRNHSTQYISHPEYPWYKLREQSPGTYESYADMVPGEWIKMKIDVHEKSAMLYLHDSKQPCLIVNDLKKGDSRGLVALWLHSSTVARYRNLVVSTK